MKDVPEELRRIPEDLADSVEWAKAIKTGKVEGTTVDENDDIPPCMTVFRDGRQLAIVFAREVNRDEGLQAAWTAVPLLSADALDFIVDVHVADQEFIERYGRTPDPHELQNLCDVEGACEIGLISDAITLLHVERGKPGEHPVAQVILPYHVHKTKRECHWIDDKISAFDERAPDSKAKATGLVVDALMQAFDKPHGFEAAKADGLDFNSFGLTPEEARIHMDCAAVGLLGRFGFAVGYAPESELAKEIFEESVKRSGILAHMTVSVGGGEVGDPEWHDPDPSNTSFLDLAGMLVRDKLEQDRKRIHEEELAEAARRRAERAAPGWRPSTPDEIYAGAANRAERRAAERAARKK